MMKKQDYIIINYFSKKSNNKSQRYLQLIYTTNRIIPLYIAVYQFYIMVLSLSASASDINKNDQFQKAVLSEQLFGQYCFLENIGI